MHTPLGAAGHATGPLLMPTAVPFATPSHVHGRPHARALRSAPQSCTPDLTKCFLPQKCTRCVRALAFLPKFCTCRCPDGAPECQRTDPCARNCV